MDNDVEMVHLAMFLDVGSVDYHVTLEEHAIESTNQKLQLFKMDLNNNNPKLFTKCVIILKNQQKYWNQNKKQKQKIYYINWRHKRVSITIN